MNIFFLILIVFLIIYFFLNWFAKSSSKKIYSFLRKSIIFVAIIFALIIAATGKYIFSLPFLLGVFKHFLLNAFVQNTLGCDQEKKAHATKNIQNQKHAPNVDEKHIVARLKDWQSPEFIV